jgi:hypothetical protein
MKKIFLCFALLASTTALVVSSCKKGEKSPNDQATTEVTGLGAVSAVVAQEAGPVANFYQTFGPKAEAFIVDAARDTRLGLRSGTSIIIPAGAFAIGKVPVTSGKVNVNVLELPNRGAMALRGVNTMVAGRILESNGNFELAADVAGKPADRELAPGRQINVAMQDRVRNGLALNLFEGGPIEVGAAKQQQFDWRQVQVPGQPASIPPVGGSFTFSWPTTGWCNPDWFMFTPPVATLTTMQVDLPGNPGPLASYLGGNGNTTVLFVPKGRNIIIQLYVPTATGVVSYTNSIPVGITGRLLAYSVTSTGAYYLASKDIVTSAANPILESLSLAPTTAATLTAALTALSTY